MTSADYGNFLFQYLEWLAPSHLGSAGQLPAADGGKWHVGLYPVTGGLVSLNPLKTDPGTADASFVVTDSVWWGTALTIDPKNYEPGWFGDAIYYPNVTGPHVG